MEQQEIKTAGRHLRWAKAWADNNGYLLRIVAYDAPNYVVVLEPINGKRSGQPVEPPWELGVTPTAHKAPQPKSHGARNVVIWLLLAALLLYLIGPGLALTGIGAGVLGVGLATLGAGTGVGLIMLALAVLVVAVLAIPTAASGRVAGWLWRWKRK